MFVLHVILFTLSVVEVFGSYWHPHQHMSWNNVVGEILVNSSIHEDVYVVDLFDRTYIYTIKHDNSEHPFNEFKLTVISNCPGHYKRTLLYSDNIKYLHCPG